MLASAAAFSDQILFDQLIFESTVFGIPIDAQTYIQTLSQMRNADERRCYLDTLIKADLQNSDHTFVTQFVSTLPSKNDEIEISANCQTQSVDQKKLQTSRRFYSDSLNDSNTEDFLIQVDEPISHFYSTKSRPLFKSNSLDLD
jgi:hypothetical protein